jgi:hypothetical protein
MHRWLPGRELVVVADSTYAVLELLKQVSETPAVSLISRLRLDAALYDPAPARAPRQHGRPRKKGARRPTLQHVLENPQTLWTRLTVNHWYGEQHARLRSVRIRRCGITRGSRRSGCAGC